MDSYIAASSELKYKFHTIGFINAHMLPWSLYTLAGV